MGACPKGKMRCDFRRLDAVVTSNASAPLSKGVTTCYRKRGVADKIAKSRRTIVSRITFLCFYDVYKRFLRKPVRLKNHQAETQDAFAIHRAIR